MAYEARRNDENQAQEDARSDAANQKAAKAGLKAVSNTGGWWGAAAKAIDKADDITGGKITEGAGKLATKANKVAPLGKSAQKMTNKVADSKLADKANDAYQAKSGKGAANAANKAQKAKEASAKGKKEAANQVKKGGENKDSLPSSDGKKNTPPKKTGGSGENQDVEPEKDKPKDGDKEKKDGKTSGLLVAGALAPIAMAMAPFFLIIVFIVVIISTITGIADYDDAFGISSVTGGDTGGEVVGITNPEQEKFYNRVKDVVDKFQNDGKTVDPLMVVSVYHALTFYGADISYIDMNKSRITKIANAMFDDSVYSETTFKNNLKNSIISDYIPKADDNLKDTIVNEVFDYVDRYYALIGKTGDNCANKGICTYDIKGFYINSSNYKKSINASDIYVRLMQCGVNNGKNAGGQWGNPLSGESLIPFEKYVLGVAYQEIGADAPSEAIRAQMVATRSYILARPTQQTSDQNWRKLEQENDKWILQVANCSVDKVYCDPDKGCSSANGDASYEQVYSGTTHGKAIKGPLDANSRLREYADSVQGETLVNNQGYIVSTDYTSDDIKKFTELANKGLDYKQILMQVYNSKYPNAGISDISKANCGKCETTGEYATWKQYSSEWGSVQIGNSGNNIKQIGCLVTSLAIQVARSGVQTNIDNFNPGTFVQALNKQNAFSGGGALNSYASVQSIAPRFKYENVISLSGKNKQDKLNTIRNIVNQKGVYAVAEVKGNTGQHWVAIESVTGDVINMMDPGSEATNMWKEYNWANTSRIVYYRVS